MPTLLDPTLLFFACGLAAGAMRSNLEIPAPISRFLSLYLLMALGLKGGFALAASGFTGQVVSGLVCAVVLAIVVPLAGWSVLRRLVAPFDAAAIAAAYGSVSAVTFVTATHVLEAANIPFGGHMAAAMALMEAPAIVLAVFLANTVRQRMARPATVLSVGSTGAAAIPLPASGGATGSPVGRIVHESLTDGAQVLLIGSMIVGYVTGADGQAALQPFAGGLFKGMLSFFLLDMGLTAARKLPALRQQSPKVLVYAVAAPPLHALLALGLARIAGLTTGDTVLLMVLAGSASYIAVPAALRHAMPEANASLYVGLALGVTFPLNLAIGIPAYIALARWASGG
jgi:hypothetical protein